MGSNSSGNAPGTCGKGTLPPTFPMPFPTSPMPLLGGGPPVRVCGEGRGPIKVSIELQNKGHKKRRCCTWGHTVKSTMGMRPWGSRSGSFHRWPWLSIIFR